MYAFVELLKPIAFKEGAILTFAIRNDEYINSRKYQQEQQDMSGESSDSNRCYRIDLNRIKNEILNEIDDGSLNTAIAQLYRLKGEVKICGLESRWQKETRNQVSTLVMPEKRTSMELASESTSKASNIIEIVE